MGSIVHGVEHYMGLDPQPADFDNVYTFSNVPLDLSHAVLPIDKEKGWTSFDVVKKLRRILQVRKIGHAGTLDPMATGLLICLVGRLATRQMERYMQLTKEYTGTIRLGETTPSYDAETAVSRRVPANDVTDRQIVEAAGTFVGEIEQVPPMYSALKVGGERLYKKARRGEEVERKRRRVTIYSFDISSISGPDVSFIISCSKGTYIRSIAHDLGNLLGVGGHLTGLRRTAIGPFLVRDAWTLPALSEAFTPKTNA